MESNNREDELRQIYGDDYVDVTDRVKCYEHGKVFYCDCDQGFGLEFEVASDYCPTCHRYVVDRKADERGPPEREEGQTSITQW